MNVQQQVQMLIVTRLFQRSALMAFEAFLERSSCQPDSHGLVGAIHNMNSIVRISWTAVMYDPCSLKAIDTRILQWVIG